MSYCPETCEDPSFCGIAEGPQRCHGHDLPPRRSVVFEGVDTGRRFHECCVQDYVENCGFVSWIDEAEWPVPLKNCLTKLWSMYRDSAEKRIEERLENAKVVQELVDDRDKFKKNYHGLMDDVEKLMKDQEFMDLKDNLKKRTDEVVKLNLELSVLKEEKEQWEAIGSSENAMNVDDEKDGIFDLTRRELQAEVVKLNSDLFDLNEEKKQCEAMEKITNEEWEKKEEAWKEEKKKLEYALYDLFKVNTENKEKLLKIKGIIGQI